METTQQKKRAARATQNQLSQMVAFFYENPGLAEGKFTAVQGKIAFQQKWEELAQQLNLMGGGEKTSEQWQVVWRDLKSRVSIKMRQRRKEMAQTGNKPLATAPLSDFEQKVIGLLGKEYVDGSQSCADSLPESEEFQRQLEVGQDDILNEPPRVLSIFEESINLQDHDEPTAQTPKRTPRRAPKRKASDEENLRGSFLNIAKQQANTLEKISEAAQTSAEAEMRRADAEMRRAEAEMRRAEAEMRQVEVLNNIASILQDITDKLAN